MVVKKDVSEAAAAAARTSDMTALKMHQENAARDRGKQYLPPETKSRQNWPDGDLDTAAARAEQPEEKGIAGGLRRHHRGVLRAGPRTVSTTDHGSSLEGGNDECSSCCS